MSNIVLEHEISIETYLALRDGVGWKKLLEEQAKTALDHSLYLSVAKRNGVPVGMGRIVGDGAVICYVQDLIVLPEAQGSGIGSLILNDLTEWVDRKRMDGSEMMFCLMCAKGREQFYEKHGFLARPTENLGPGMIRYLRDPQH